MSADDLGLRLVSDRPEIVTSRASRASRHAHDIASER
jgi:hypothetical protein